MDSSPRGDHAAHESQVMTLGLLEYHYTMECWQTLDHWRTVLLIGFLYGVHYSYSLSRKEVLPVICFFIL